MKKPTYRRITAVLVSFLFNSYSLFSQPAVLDSFINKEFLRSTIEFLASDSLKGRFTGSPEANKAANFIADEFRKAGMKAPDSSGKYLVPFSYFSYPVGNNVIGILPGSERPSELIFFSAHYDHIGTTAPNTYIKIGRRSPENGRDSIYNGANDNASGTASLISLARYFAAAKTNKRTLIFVAFSGEELGLIGSSALAATLADPGSVTCVINLEMLGRGSSPFLTGSQLGDLRSILNKELARIDVNQFKKNFFRAERYREQNLFTRSDNYPFAKLKIPAHTIMVGSDQDFYYHTVEDEPSTLNYRLIERVTRAIALAVMPIINGEITPKRIEAPRETTEPR